MPRKKKIKAPATFTMGNIPANILQFPARRITPVNQMAWDLMWDMILAKATPFALRYIEQKEKQSETSQGMVKSKGDRAS